jgi:hypothetical protein
VTPKTLEAFRIIITVSVLLRQPSDVGNGFFSTEVSKLTERIAELKSQLINVKDEQDFNINQLIKHRNDLKLKMDKIKEEMGNGLVDDKEKLKHLALMGSQIFKVRFHFMMFDEHENHFRFLLLLLRNFKII